MKKLVQKIKDKLSILNSDKGFTLIELLVTVLIIGVLAAIALPQYNKAVEKSKATQALSIFGSLVKAIDSYYLVHNEYPTKFNQLEIEIPWTGNVNPYHDLADWRSNEDWSLALFNMTKWGCDVSIARIKGKYEGTLFRYGFYRKDPAENINQRKIVCVERKVNAGDISKYKGTPGSYCNKIFNTSATPYFNHSEARHYLMP